MTHTMRDNILSLLHSGFSIKEIATHTGKSEWVIANWLVSTKAIRRA